MWVAPDSDIYQFDNPQSLDKWMAAYPEVRDEVLKRLNTFEEREQKRNSSETQPDLFDH
jgi:hypothetical protein